MKPYETKSLRTLPNSRTIVPISTWILILLFFLKTVILGLWIVPLWNIPDETGHFAYARQVASGEGVLPLRKAKIEADILTNCFQKPHPAESNYIAQHPPTYYVISGLAWKIATYFTNNREWLFRAPRVTSAIFGALTLLFIFKICLSFGLGVNACLAVTAGFSAIPMFTWLSSGTNHDTLVSLLGCISAYYFTRFAHKQKKVHAYLCCAFMSFAAATKMTALVVLPPLFILLLLETDKHYTNKLKHTLLLLISSLAVPSLWLIRNYIVYGNPFATASSITIKHDPFSKLANLSFPVFLHRYPVLEHFYTNFFGLIGWKGSGAGKLHMFQISPPFLTFYEILGLAVYGFTITWCIKAISSNHTRTSSNLPAQDNTLYLYLSARLMTYNKKILWPVTSVATGCVVLATPCLVKTTAASWLVVPTFISIFLVFLLATTVFLVPVPRPQRFAFYAVLIVAFFSAVLLWKIYRISQLDGQMRATQGRYFYPILGFIIIGFVIPALRQLGRYAERVALPVAITICLTEAVFFFVKVFPFVTGPVGVW